MNTNKFARVPKILSIHTEIDLTTIIFPLISVSELFKLQEVDKLSKNSTSYDEWPQQPITIQNKNILQQKIDYLI